MNRAEHIAKAEELMAVAAGLDSVQARTSLLVEAQLHLQFAALQPAETNSGAAGSGAHSYSFGVSTGNVAQDAARHWENKANAIDAARALLAEELAVTREVVEQLTQENDDYKADFEDMRDGVRRLAGRGYSDLERQVADLTAVCDGLRLSLRVAEDNHKKTMLRDDVVVKNLKDKLARQVVLFDLAKKWEVEYAGRLDTAWNVCLAILDDANGRTGAPLKPDPGTVKLAERIVRIIRP